MANSLADSLRFAFLRKILTALTLAIALGCFVLFFYLGDRYHIAALKGFGALLLLSGLFIAVFTLPEVFARMEEAGTFLFRTATAHILNGYILKLCFVPIVGPALERFLYRKKKRNPFFIEDEKTK